MVDGTIETRVAGEADAAALAMLNEAFNEVRMTPERMAERIAACRNLETAILAYDSGVAIGFACLRLMPWLCYAVPYAELTELFVLESHRRRGAARALVAHAEALARAAGAEELRMLTGHDNAAARAFYAALGYDDEEEVLLARRLQ